ncbi:MAG: helix-turn-helix transcriptional regulator [Parabacteroides sp.]|mgnify:FL=1|jgi:putative transcriptional regulator|uniref:HTH cro/C1-type domain-containing protein n=2 Tax=root TaxID=1 RepID=A0A644U4K5_9ZZZZ|nr:helix-turn-helix transcriptional regulator [Parabacteroides sp.]MBP7938540.1 helix-turn-helix transcriptional regulator [Parabacteroides sp.]MBP7954516.1 helix-turn-helix transcriptional regulator [Parabacteroides sp.]MBP8011457.1 helix-turn-helix transcriptional regulator [Parabacteroides sp.]MEA4810370.1 helix-turn-helix transcriptional regulator [Macellibacteroides fermentans]
MNNTIRIERAIKKMTQQQLADLVQVSRQTINTVELGKYIPSTVLALKIAKVFEKNVDDIFQLDETDWNTHK